MVDGEAGPLLEPGIPKHMKFDAKSISSKFNAEEPPSPQTAENAKNISGIKCLGSFFRLDGSYATGHYRSRIRHLKVENDDECNVGST